MLAKEEEKEDKETDPKDGSKGEESDFGPDTDSETTTIIYICGPDTVVQKFPHIIHGWAAHMQIREIDKNDDQGWGYVQIWLQQRDPNLILITKWRIFHYNGPCVNASDNSIVLGWGVAMHEDYFDRALDNALFWWQL